MQVLLGHLLLGGDVDSLGAGEHVGSEVAVSCRNVLFGALALSVAVFTLSAFVISPAPVSDDAAEPPNGPRNSQVEHEHSG